MKYIQKLSVFVGVMVIAFGVLVSVTHAVTPTVNVSLVNNNQVQLNVYGDANSTVVLYYYPFNYSGSGIYVTNLGTTNSSGYLSTSLYSNSYNIPVNASVYVMVNGNQSSTVTWPYYDNNYNYNNTPVSLSTTNLTLQVGQSQSITIYGGSNYYISNTYSNNNIVNASINGTTLTLYASNPGSATVTVCSNNTYYYNNTNTTCASVYVTVQANQVVAPNYYYNYPTPANPSYVTLNQVPYTGIGSNLKVGFFMFALAAWTAGLAYILVRRKLATK